MKRKESMLEIVVTKKFCVKVIRNDLTKARFNQKNVNFSKIKPSVY